jgi:hypothetical protein
MSLVSRHARLVRHVGALLLFCLALLTWFHGIALHPGSRVSCCAADGTSSIRDLWLSSFLHKSPWTMTHDPFNGAPEGVPRTPATLLANGGVQTAFIWWSRGLLGLVGAWNLFAFIGLVGTSMATFALLDWLGCTFVASLFGAYVFGFSPYALTRVYFGHLGLMQNWIFVVAVIAMLHVRSGRTYRSAALAGLAIALGFYISAYQGLFAGVIAAAFYVVDLVRGPGRQERIRTIALASTSLWASVVALAPILILYVRERSSVTSAIGHTYGDLYGFAAHMGGYFLPSPTNPFFHWLQGIHPADLNEQTNFFGYTTFALAIAAAVLVLRRDRWLRASEARWGTALSMILLAPVAFLLSLPPSYHLDGVPIPTPSAVLGLATTFWRVYARFGVVAGFALAMLAALALSALARRPGRAWRLLGPIALILVYVEILPGNVGTFPTSASAAPAWVSWLAGQPRGIVATYPMTRGWGPPNALMEEAFFWQTVDHDPGFVDVNANYRQFLSRKTSIRLLTYDLGDPLAARVLATKGVRYVVVDPATYRAIGRKTPTLDPRHYGLLARAGQVRIYSVNAPPVDLDRALRANAARLRRLRNLPPLPRAGRPGLS